MVNLIPSGNLINYAPQQQQKNTKMAAILISLKSARIQHLDVLPLYPCPFWQIVWTPIYGSGDKELVFLENDWDMPLMYW